jgi:archaellum component FlaC
MTWTHNQSKHEMADFQTASARIGLAHDVWSLIQYLRKVKAALGTIQQDIDGLVSELKSLNDLYDHLDKEYNQQAHETTRDADESDWWSPLRQTLEAGRASVKKLDSEVKKVYGDDPEVQGWLDRFQKQHRHRKHLPTLDGIRAQVRNYNGILQMWLTRILLKNQCVLPGDSRGPY